MQLKIFLIMVLMSCIAFSFNKVYCAEFEVTENFGISNLSETTFGGESLVTTGFNLSECNIRISTENDTEIIIPTYREYDKTVVVIPERFAQSTMSVEAVKDNKISKSILINAPTVWWVWDKGLKSNSSGQTIRFFGRNLSLEKSTPKAFIEINGEVMELLISNANPHQIEAILPEIDNGEYNVWIYNGSGGEWGKSKRCVIKVLGGSNSELPVFRVSNYGATPNDDISDIGPINATISAAELAGGGRIVFDAGEYLIDAQIVVANECENGIYFEGVGMGSYDNTNLKSASPNFQSGDITGVATTIRYKELSAANSIYNYQVLSNIFKVQASKCTIKNMNLINLDYGRTRELVITVNAPDFVMDGVRCIKVDARDTTDVSITNNLGLITTVRFDYRLGDMNATVKNCEIHCPEQGFAIGEKYGETNIPATKFVKIQNTDIIGYFTGKHPRATSTYYGTGDDGIRLHNAQNIIVENCTFKGADRENSNMLNRMVCSQKNSNRNLYIAYNMATDVGPHPSVPSVDGNMGEQILFHDGYETGGIFGVISADSNNLTLDMSNIPELVGAEVVGQMLDNTGSKITTDIKYDERYVAYIASGRGAGQYRIIKDVEILGDTAHITLDSEWNVFPDSKSRIMVECVYRNATIYNNVIDNKYILEQSGFKSGGVLLYYKCFNIVVNKNTFKNLAFGVAINTAYRWPTAWNLITENTMENIGGMWGQGGDSVSYPKFYSEEFRSYNVVEAEGFVTESVWFSVGNIFRNNNCTNGTAGVSVTTRSIDKKMLGNDWDTIENGGCMLGVIENNKIVADEDVLLIERPANTTVVRNNYSSPYLRLDWDGDFDRMRILYETIQSPVYDVKIEQEYDTEYIGSWPLRQDGKYYYRQSGSYKPSVKYNLKMRKSGNYEAYFYKRKAINGSEKGMVEVSYNGGTYSVGTSFMSQNTTPELEYIGTFNFSAEQENYIKLSIADGNYMFADYILLRYVDDVPYPLIKYNISNGEYSTAGRHKENESISILEYNGVEFINTGGITGLFMDVASYKAKFKLVDFSDSFKDLYNIGGNVAKIKVTDDMLQIIVSRGGTEFIYCEDNAFFIKSNFSDNISFEHTICVIYTNKKICVLLDGREIISSNFIGEIELSEVAIINNCITQMSFYDYDIRADLAVLLNIVDSSGVVQNKDLDDEGNYQLRLTPVAANIEKLDKGKLWIAFYDNIKLSYIKEIEILNLYQIPDDDGRISYYINLENIESDLVKAFIWDGDLKPLTMVSRKK